MDELRQFLLTGVEQSQRVLGRGAYGSVFLGEWHGVAVAIKRLHPFLMGIDENNRPTKAFVRFMQEYPTLRRLQHPSIVQGLGMVVPLSRADSYGLVMEYLPVALRKRYSDTPRLNQLQEVSVMLDIARGVEFLHSRAVLHRDLTTSNIMLTSTADSTAMPVHAKISDAGMACVLDDPTDDQQALSVNLGTLAYMAPEIRTAAATGALVRRRYGRPVDIYALGVSALAMCARQEPSGMFDCIKDDLTVGVRDLATTDHPLQHVVELCIEKDSKQRPTASHLCVRLAEIQHCESKPQNNATQERDIEIALLRKELNGKEQETEAAAAERQELLRDQQRSHHKLTLANQELADLRQEMDRMKAEHSRVLEDCKKAIAKRNHDYFQLVAMQHIATCGAKHLASSIPKIITENLSPSTSSRIDIVGRGQGGSAGPKCWAVKPSWPAGAIFRCSQPCIYNDYVYCSFWMKNTSSCSALLYRIPVTAIGREAWQPVAMPEGLQVCDAYLFSHSGLLCIMFSTQPEPCLYHIVYMDDQTDQWQVVATLPERKSAFGIAVIDTTLIVLGGSKGPFFSDPTVHTAHTLDLLRPDFGWQQLPDLPCGCINPHVATQGSLVHVLGYLQKDSQDMHLVLSMDLGVVEHDRRWSNDTLPPVPYGECGATMMYNCLAVVGGGRHSLLSNQALLYDSEDKQFLPLPALNTAQCRAFCFLHCGKLYVFDGLANGAKRTNHFEVLTL